MVRFFFKFVKPSSAVEIKRASSDDERDNLNEGFVEDPLDNIPEIREQQVDDDDDEWGGPLEGSSEDTGIDSTSTGFPAVVEALLAVAEADFMHEWDFAPAHHVESDSDGIVFGPRSSAEDVNNDATSSDDRAIAEGPSSSDTTLEALQSDNDDNDGLNRTPVNSVAPSRSLLSHFVVYSPTTEHTTEGENSTSAADAPVETSHSDSDEEPNTADNTTILVPHPTLRNVLRPAENVQTLVVTDHEMTLATSEPTVVRKRGLTASMRRRTARQPLPSESSEPEGRYPPSGFQKKANKGARKRLLTGDDDGAGPSGLQRQATSKFVKYTDKAGNIRSIRRAPLVESGLSTVKRTGIIVRSQDPLTRSAGEARQWFSNRQANFEQFAVDLQAGNFGIEVTTSDGGQIHAVGLEQYDGDAGEEEAY